MHASHNLCGPKNGGAMNNTNNDTSIDSEIAHTVMVEEMLQMGLQSLCTASCVDRAKKETNLTQFKMKFGVLLVTACTLCEDLQKSLCGVG